MKSRYSHIITLVTAIFAFLPVMSVDFLLDSYVRVRERALLQVTADSIAERVQAIAYDTISSLRLILASVQDDLVQVAAIAEELADDPRGAAWAAWAVAVWLGTTMANDMVIRSSAEEVTDALREMVRKYEADR